MTPLLDEHGNPIIIPAGPLDPGFKSRVEKALNAAVPDKGKMFAVTALYDLDNKVLDAEVGIRSKDGNFKFAIKPSWNGKDVSGQLMLQVSF